ncbi:IclR family transcriptional regulator C-terminal domain-containing protein [Streptomyces sp. NPDC058385]|uniref:IclR family transcriptional regulator domain-containing protein n=1 Tax=Streptomyces sp. NPDC058385 TaxID=3346473 RepID=UPI003655DA2E
MCGTTGSPSTKNAPTGGLIAVGVPVRDRDGTALAGLSVSMPSVRYDPHQLQSLVTALNTAAHALEDDLAEQLRTPTPQRKETPYSSRIWFRSCMHH